MITCVILYHGEKHKLSQLLVSLQPQLHTDDDIYILDGSKDGTARELATQYGSTRCYIFVERVDFLENDKALQYGFQSMKENKQHGALILEDSCVISSTFISNLKKAIKHDEWRILAPRISGSNRMDSNFKWFNPPTKAVSRTTYVDRSVVYFRKDQITEDLFIRREVKDVMGVFKNELVMVLAP